MHTTKRIHWGNLEPQLNLEVHGQTETHALFFCLPYFQINLTYGCLLSAHCPVLFRCYISRSKPRLDFLKSDICSEAPELFWVLETEVEAMVFNKSGLIIIPLIFRNSHDENTLILDKWHNQGGWAKLQPCQGLLDWRHSCSFVKTPTTSTNETRYCNLLIAWQGQTL